jgi:hypothetical protein
MEDTPPGMRIVWVKTLWGVTKAMGNTPPVDSYARLFRSIAADGFTAIACTTWKIEDKMAFAAALDATGLLHVAAIQTCTPPGDNNGSRDIEHHLSSLLWQLDEAAQMKPILVNVHSGCDSWSPVVARSFLERAVATEAAYPGLLICHETHRSRILFNPWITRDLCRAVPNLKLTADLSHFCVVAERVFPADDPDWAEVLSEVAQHTRFIHARVGYAEGPQVSDPRAPEHAESLERHEA